MTITDFLLARIAEDSRLASEAKWAMQGAWFPSADDAVDALVQACSPDRALVECAAKRAIIELCPEVSLAHKGIEIEMGGPEPDPDLGEQILRNLAAIYADHPDYQPEWKLDVPSEAG